MVGIGLNVKGSVRAVELYCEAFGLELGYHVKNEDGTFFHSELMKNGEPQLAVVETEDRGGSGAVTLGIEFASPEELRRAFDILSKTGEVTMDICELPWCPCASEVTDEFGVRWYLSVAQHRPDDSFTVEEYMKTQG